MVRNINFECSSFENILTKHTMAIWFIAAGGFLATPAGLFIVGFIPDLQIFNKKFCTFLLLSWSNKLRLKSPAIWNGLLQFSVLDNMICIKF